MQVDNVKEISKVLYEKEQKNLSLNSIIQRLFIDELEIKMDEIFVAYAQRLTRMQNLDNWQIFPIFSVLDINYCEEEIGNPNLEPVKFISETDTLERKRALLSQMKPVQEIKISSIDKGYKEYLADTQLKAARHSILFWNTIFQLMDKLIENVDFEQRRIFSAQFITLVENKIQNFICEYVDSFKEVLNNAASFSEEQLLSACANINTCLNLAKLSMEYEVVRLSPHLRLFDHDAWKNAWKNQINEVYNSCHELIFTYLKFKLLNHIPRMFSEYRKVYTQPSESNVQKTPSPLFLKLAAILENVKDNLLLIMSVNDMIFYMHKLMHAVNFMIEYVIYWDYHSSSKSSNSNVFFMSQQSIAKLNIKFSEINAFLASNALELTYFAKENIPQFVFDMHFLAIIYNANFCKEAKSDKKISNDEFLNKAISCFCKKKSLNIKDFPYAYSTVKDALQNYCITQFKIDIQSVILKEKQSVNSASQISIDSDSPTQYSTTSSLRERIFAINLTYK